MVTSKYVKSCQIYEFAKAILSKLYNGNSYRNINCFHLGSDENYQITYARNLIPFPYFI